MSGKTLRELLAERIGPHGGEVVLQVGQQLAAPIPVANVDEVLAIRKAGEALAPIVDAAQAKLKRPKAGRKRKNDELACFAIASRDRTAFARAHGLTAKALNQIIVRYRAKHRPRN